ncbi:VWA domain-containing protein [Shimia sagamensis]|uniref:Ca-activated chloride channel family protein n=1 Tax=Shimia sagamensis TaxID=1566352 RepID=A0ABY1PAL3_9RHOB|nr:VWA domain-containing protein [Shimia sagamensis]SMP28934.1 Ca-activated chloride channel family protein [Shimia sagamensis]
MFELSHPLVLMLLPLPLLWRRFVPPYRQRQDALRVPFFDQIAQAAGLTVQDGAAIVAHKRRALICGGIMWALLVLALAGPVRLGPPQEITKATRDVILAIDISGSMDTRDFPGEDGKPVQRLAAVQDVVEAFLADRSGDRVALIVFGTRAYVQAPLTEDLDTVRTLLAQTKVGMAGPHTALGDSIGLAIKTFEASEIEERLLILLSDGNDTASRMSPVNAAEIARDKGVQMFAIGVGDPEASGEDRLDMELLTDLAKRTGGDAYFAADAEALDKIYEEIDRLNPREVETLSWRPQQNLAHWPLMAALGLGLTLLLSLWVRDRRRTPA